MIIRKDRWSHYLLIYLFCYVHTNMFKNLKKNHLSYAILFVAVVEITQLVLNPNSSVAKLRRIIGS